MSGEKAGGYISQITFNNGESVCIEKNDIVVFVGPNNAGKSQSLKDIFALSGKKVPSVVVSDVCITKYNAPVSVLLDCISTCVDNGGRKDYQTLGSSFYIFDYSDSTFPTTPLLEGFRNLFVANLDTSTRLTICTPPSSITRGSPKAHPIHYAAFDGSYRKWLSDNFKKAFGIELTPNTQYGASIPLCIGKPVKLDGEYEDEQTRQEVYADILSTYKQVQNQGDGIKSFTGILLYLMLDNFCTYLIDEPESFLHPPQAKIMGQIIGETLSDDQQAFISTHSEEVLKGLLEVCPERVKIVRITRENDTNYFSVLDNESFYGVWNDPLLKYSNIMSSLFHKTVVLCESDSDCKMYSIIDNHIKQSEGKYSETLFIHCGGKHRMAKIASALRMLNVDVKLIPDIDILNDETVFKGIVEAFGGTWESIKTDYNIVVSNLHSPQEKVVRTVAKAAINSVFSKSESTNLSAKDVSEIRDAVKTVSKWDNIKRCGSAAIPAGDATAAYGRIEEALRRIGIYIVHVGELECFVREVGGHGPEWVNAVLEAYPDLDSGVYSMINNFIKNIGL